MPASKTRSLKDSKAQRLEGSKTRSFKEEHFVSPGRVSGALPGLCRMDICPRRSLRSFIAGLRRNPFRSHRVPAINSFVHLPRRSLVLFRTPPMVNNFSPGRVSGAFPGLCRIAPVGVSAVLSRDSDGGEKRC